MTKFGQREVHWSGATPEDHKVLKNIIADYFAYRLSTFPKLKKLCEDSPDFAMAHILKGYLLTSMGTQGTIPAATKAADRAADCPEGLTENEKGHLKALRAWIEGNSTDACNHWDEIIIDDPQDLLAIKLQHFSLFWLGRPDHMRDVIARVKPKWDKTMEGYPTLMGMESFALEEMGQYQEAEKIGRLAVEMDPNDLWAIHAVAHVYEMQSNLDAGMEWLNQPVDKWQDRNPFREHLWWHTALFAYEKGHYDKVLDLYDSSIWPDTSNFYLDIQNAASILIRLEFAGVDVGKRWLSLSEAAQERVGDHVLLFTEPHYTMAFGSVGDAAQIEKQISSLNTFASENLKKREGKVASELAVPICMAVDAFFRQDYKTARDLLWPLRYDYQPIGGSHAQRDVFNLLLIESAVCMEDYKMARALLVERSARHKNSFSTQTKLDHVNAALNLSQPEVGLNA